MKKKVILVIAIILVLVLIGLVLNGVIQKANYKLENPIATIQIEGYDKPIVVELYPEEALNTVKNFITLANGGFYNGLIIHRVEPDFVIQGGSSDGEGGKGATMRWIDESIEKDSDADKEYMIVGEFIRNGYDNNLKHEKGTVSMARATYGADAITEGYNSAGSQFFISLRDEPSLNGSYAAFGKVIDGMDTAIEISKVETHVDVDEESGEETPTTKPEKDVVISSITVDTKGVDYGKPEVIDAFDFSSWFMEHMNFS